MAKRKRRKKAKAAEPEETKASSNHWRRGEPHALARHVLQQAQLRRLALGYPQLLIDEAAGFQIGMTAKYEIAQRLPSLQFLAYWAQALGCIIALVPLPGEGPNLPANQRGHRHDDLAPHLRAVTNTLQRT